MKIAYYLVVMQIIFNNLDELQAIYYRDSSVAFFKMIT
jgi:hypothetical protein